MTSPIDHRDDCDAAYGTIVDPPVLSILAKEREAGAHYREAFDGESGS